MAETVYLQIDELAAERFTQGLARSLEVAIVEAIVEGAARAAPPALDRDRIAAMLLQGMLADESGGEGSTYAPDVAARRAYDFADALLAARALRAAAALLAEVAPTPSEAGVTSAPAAAPEIDWTAWEPDGDGGFRLELDDHVGYEIAPAPYSRPGFDLFWREGMVIRERVGSSYPTVDDAQRAAHEDYHRNDSRENAQ